MNVAFERVVLRRFSAEPLKRCPPHRGGTHHTLLQDNPAPLRLPQMDFTAAGTAPKVFHIQFMAQCLLNTFVRDAGR